MRSRGFVESPAFGEPLSKVQGELRVSIGYHFCGEPKPLVDMIKVQLGNLWPHDGGGAGEEDGGP